MKRKWKSMLSLMLSLCMILGMAQIPAAVSYAAEDGVIDTSEAGYEIVKYLTDTTETGTSITEPQSKNDILQSFLLGTESMEWSVDFKTSGSGLQALLGLSTSSQYYGLYIKEGKLAFEVRQGQKVSQSAATNYADGAWHTAVLVLEKNGKTTITVDGTRVAEADTNSASCIKGLSWTPENFSIGGMEGYSSASGWKFSGSMKNIMLKKSVPAPVAEPVFTQVNPAPGSTSESIAEQAAGTLQMTYRLKEASASDVTLASLNGGLTVTLSGSKVKLAMGAATAEFNVTNTSLASTKWHNLAVTADGTNAAVYVDGVKAGSSAFSEKISGAITYGSGVYFSKVDVYGSALTAQQAASVQETTSSTAYPDYTAKADKYYKGPNIGIFNAGFDNSVSYRIPSLVTSKKTGTVFAGIDKRWDGSGDVGVIDNVIRRSEDNGKTWGPVIPVIDLANGYGYTMDAEMVVDNDETSEHYGRVYMIVDMFRDGVSLWGAQPGTGYVQIDGKYYQQLTDNSGNTYTVRENGVVYDSNNQVTAYEVETESEAPYNQQGNLYKNGVKIGNIYKNSELTMHNTCYLWMTYSDDDGLTWSLPKDITPMVKADWMTFFGLGPGAGVQLQSGRLIFTTYCMDAQNRSNRFSSYNIYSDDDGETWHRGASPNDISDTQNSTNSTRELNESCIIELNNGHLIQFMKNATANVAMAVSTTQGESWGEVTYAQGIKEPYCEMSALHFPRLVVDPADGQAKEAIIFANPTGGRDHGTVRVAFVNADDTLDWKYAKLIEDERFMYTSLTAMNDGNIGLIYENEKGGMAQAAFTSFSVEYLMDANTHEETPVPTAITAVVKDSEGNVTNSLAAGNEVYIEAACDQIVFAAGNVTLNVKVGDETKEAALIGNKDAQTLAFRYVIGANDTGEIIATNEINVKEGGAAENIYNTGMTDNPFVIKSASAGVVEDNSGFDVLPTTGMTATAGSAYNGGNEGPASNVLDGNLDTHWHSNYPTDDGVREKHYLTIALGGSRLVSGLQYTPRKGSMNGTVTECQIEVSTDGQTFVPVARAEWPKNTDVKTVNFGGAALATHVRFRVLETKDKWATAGEIRIIGTNDTNASQDKTALLKFMTECSSCEDEALEQALAAAAQTAQNKDASAADVTNAVNALNTAKSAAATAAKTGLSSLIANGEGKKKENYSISSWAAYQEALSVAQGITEDSSDQDAIQAYQDLKKAEAKLEASGAVRTETAKKASREAVEQEKATIEAGQGDYTKASWYAYAKAYADLEAEIKKENTDTDADTLNGLILALKNAKQALTFEEVTDPVLEEERGKAESALAAAKTEIEKGQGGYTTDSWNAYKDAYELLKTAFEENHVSADELKALIAGLNTAKDGLKLAADVEAREESAKALEAAKAVIEKGQGNYTDDSWTAYTAAYTELEKALKENKDAAFLREKIAALTSVKLVEKPAEPKPGPGDNNIPKPPVNDQKPALEAGKEYQTSDGLKYKVIDAAKKTVSLAGTANKKKITSLNVKATVTLNGETCKVTEIGAKAFANCKKLKKVTIGTNVTNIGKQAFSGCGNLKTVTIKAKALKKVGTKAFKGINKKAVLKVPKAKKAKYTKLLAKKGQPKTVKIK